MRQIGERKFVQFCSSKDCQQWHVNGWEHKHTHSGDPRGCQILTSKRRTMECENLWEQSECYSLHVEKVRYTVIQGKVTEKCSQWLQTWTAQMVEIWYCSLGDCVNNSKPLGMPIHKRSSGGSHCTAPPALSVQATQQGKTAWKH